MAASYKKLFKLMIDREIKNKDLAAMAGISPTTLANISYEHSICVATKKLIETPEGVHFALLGGAGQKKGVQLVD